MAKVTREQLNRWNAKLQNGFLIDLQRLLIHNEKMPIRYVELGDGKRIAASLSYRDVYEGYRDTGKRQPVLHLALWKDSGTSGMMQSFGMGAYIEIGTAQDKKNFNELAKLSGTIDDEKIMALAAEKMPQLNNAFLV